MINTENYRQEKLTINLVRANIFGILIIIPILLLFALPYWLIWADQFQPENLRKLLTGISPGFVYGQTLLVFIILLAGIVIHELIHGITWARFTENGFRAMKFGVIWKMLTPYCHCKEPLKVGQYILGGVMPAVILGIIPCIIAIIIGHFGLLLFGIFFTMAAAGDFLIIHLLWKEKKEDLVLDHPSEAGCYIYRKDDL